ncbi:hypothetical protein GGX14DRAFT_605813 [Mycena pura]|uniref:Uncharacterized protein n=1 Tax=Mycena pura TaxID=153505 RepID=A0AAD6Y3W6_9AGAR|nr:hypothetical protein GGX14DRAFT_605813 [Mycena pura]
MEAGVTVKKKSRIQGHSVVSKGNSKRMCKAGDGGKIAASRTMVEDQVSAGVPSNRRHDALKALSPSQINVRIRAATSTTASFRVLMTSGNAGQGTRPIGGPLGGKLRGPRDLSTRQLEPVTTLGARLSSMQEFAVSASDCFADSRAWSGDEASVILALIKKPPQRGQHVARHGSDGTRTTHGDVKQHAAGREETHREEFIPAMKSPITEMRESQLPRTEGSCNSWTEVREPVGICRLSMQLLNVEEQTGFSRKRGQRAGRKKKLFSRVWSVVDRAVVECDVRRPPEIIFTLDRTAGRKLFATRDYPSTARNSGRINDAFAGGSLDTQSTRSEGEQSPETPFLPVVSNAKPLGVLK